MTTLQIQRWIFPRRGERFPLSSGRVALLGIAQRQIRLKYAQNSRKQQRSKPLPASIQTLGDLIQVKRMEKNLSPGHLAAKMGIATALIRSVTHPVPVVTTSRGVRPAWTSTGRRSENICGWRGQSQPFRPSASRRVARVFVSRGNRRLKRRYPSG